MTRIISRAESGLAPARSRSYIDTPCDRWGNRK